MTQNPTTGWLQAFNVIKTNNALSDDALGIFAINLRFDVDDIKSIAADSITGGGDDKKCDVIYVDKERQIAVVAQCYMSTKDRPAAPSNKASDLNTAISWLLSAPIDTLPDGLKERADELRSAISQGDIKRFFIWYVHNLPSSENVKTELRTVETTAKLALAKFPSGDSINIFAEEISENILNQLYIQAEHTIMVTDQISTKIHDAIEISEGEWKSVVTTVDGLWLHNLYHRYGTSLFSANLRGYLGSRESDSNINNNIKTTANREPENFFVFNNGITALVLDYNLGKRSRSGRKLSITGISIVNGAQTTGSIAHLDPPPAQSLKVAIRFVKASKDELISNVVRFNNSQNKLQAADFRSTDAIQERLRTEFRTVPEAEYDGGRRGGISDAIKRSKFALPAYTVGQSLAAFHGEPVMAYDKKSELWTNEKMYRQIFTERTTAKHIIFCYSLLSSLNDRKIKLNQSQKIDPSSLTEYEKKNLEFLNKKGASYLLIYTISQSIEAILGKPVTNRFDLQFSKNLSPSDSEIIWNPIVDLFLSLSNQLTAAFSRNRITNDGVTNSVPNFVGVVTSLRDLHRETFQKFAASTVLKS